MKNVKKLHCMVILCLFIISACDNSPEEEFVQMADVESQRTDWKIALKIIREYAERHDDIELIRFDAKSGKEIETYSNARVGDDEELAISFDSNLSASSFNSMNQMLLDQAGVSIYDVAPEISPTSLSSCRTVWKFYFFNDGSWSAAVYRLCGSFVIEDMSYKYVPEFYVPIQTVSVGHPKITSYLKVIPW